MLDVLVISTSIPASSLAQLKALFSTVHYHPDGAIPPEVLLNVEVWLSPMRGLPTYIQSAFQVPKLAHVQLLSAGAEKALASPAIARTIADGQLPAFSLATASGTHTMSIAQYVIGTTIMFTNGLLKQATFARDQQRWGSGNDFADDLTPFDASNATNETRFFNRDIRNSVVGILGYGHIGREVARLFQSMGARVLAANTDGTARIDDGYTVRGTGDPAGTIPFKYYSTADPDQLSDFLRNTDILVSILPSTSATRHSLNATKLGLLRPNAIFINVGRGDLIKSEEILVALAKKGGLLGVALDVTDPEPLPDGHVFWRHPKMFVSPHLSGEAQGELQYGVEILLENVARLRAGRKLANLVDYRKGY